MCVCVCVYKYTYICFTLIVISNKYKNTKNRDSLLLISKHYARCADASTTSSGLKLNVSISKLKCSAKHDNKTRGTPTLPETSV